MLMAFERSKQQLCRFLYIMPPWCCSASYSLGGLEEYEMRKQTAGLLLWKGNVRKYSFLLSFQTLVLCLGTLNSVFMQQEKFYLNKT